MGQVAVTFKIMPDHGADLESIKKALKDIDAKDIREEPIGFGLVALQVMFVFDDKAGANTDELSDKMKSISGVASVEAGEATLF